MPAYGKRMSRTRGLLAGLISALVLSIAWIGCAPATAPSPPRADGDASDSRWNLPHDCIGSTRAPNEDVEGRRLLIRQSLLKGYADRPQRAWGTVEHLRGRDQASELLRFSPDFRTDGDPQVDVILTESSHPSPEEISASPARAEISRRRGAQEYPIPAGSDFGAVVLREADSAEPLAIATLQARTECEDVPPESVIVRLAPANMYTSCLLLDEGLEDLGLTGTPPDEVDISTYRLVVDGAVENPLSLDYQGLLAYTPHAEIVLLICPYTFADAAEWTGTPLSATIQDAKPLSGGAEAVFTAMGGYEKVLPLEELTDRGAFLAYWINGGPLPLEHGYPLRLVAPSFGGHDWVKWLIRIEVLKG